MTENIFSPQQKEWNSFVAQEASFALLQSWEWGIFKEMMGWNVFRVGVKRAGHIVAGAQMLIRSIIPGMASVAYIPRGPLGRWTEASIAGALLSKLHRLARDHKAIFLKIEPPLFHGRTTDRFLEQHQFRPSLYTNQPRATILLDLTQDLNEIFNSMRRQTRRHIRHGIRSEIEIREGSSADLSAFVGLMRRTARRRSFSARSNDYYKNEWKVFSGNQQAILLMAFSQNMLIAARMVYRFGSCAAEFHGGFIPNLSNLHANYLLVWEGIKWAKARGCNIYDLWGIPDEIGLTVSGGNVPPASCRTDGLWGLYRFKSGFGKKITCYCGGYDYVYRPRMYCLFNNRFLDERKMDFMAAMMDRLRIV